MTEPEFLRQFTRELPVTLDDSELQTYGKMLAEKVREEELAEDKKKQATSEHTAKIKTIRNEIKRIADARAKGAELRPVGCGERLRGNVIEIVRLDTKIVVDTRPAELQDLQTSMPGFDTSDVTPAGFDEGRDVEPDNVLPFTGTNVTSSVGDTVHVGDPDDVDAELQEVLDGDGGSDEPSAIETDVEPESTAPVDEDAWLDEKLEQRAKDQETDQKATIAPKVARERSKKANAAKATTKAKKKK